MKREQNDLLTQTGPGTPMGELFRRRWIPALLSKELPLPDCPPVRVKLLSARRARDFRSCASTGTGSGQHKCFRNRGGAHAMSQDVITTIEELPTP